MKLSTWPQPKVTVGGRPLFRFGFTFWLTSIIAKSSFVTPITSIVSLSAASKSSDSVSSRGWPPVNCGMPSVRPVCGLVCQVLAFEIW